MLKILIADDHEIVRLGLKQILLEEFPHAKIDEAGDTDTFIRKAVGGKWDIVISDLSMPGGGGLEALRKIRKQIPELPVLIISIYPEDQYALRVIKAGASGYLNKNVASEELVKAVKRILSGKKYVTNGVANQLADTANESSDALPHELLSERELAVFKLLAKGKPLSEIASRLSVGATTVSTFRWRILDKMKMKSNADIIHYAIEHKLI
jgi:DNA-binding NarL/FixJ family response regulator